MEVNKKKEANKKKLPKRLLVKIAARFDLDPRTVEARFDKGTDPIVTHQDTLAIIKAYYTTSVKKGMDKLGISKVTAPSPPSPTAAPVPKPAPPAPPMVEHKTTSTEGDIAERKDNPPAVVPPEVKTPAQQAATASKQTAGIRPKMNQ